MPAHDHRLVETRLRFMPELSVQNLSVALQPGLRAVAPRPRATLMLREGGFPIDPAGPRPLKIDLRTRTPRSFDGPRGARLG
jgi:hypothetical protein